MPARFRVAALLFGWAAIVACLHANAAAAPIPVRMVVVATFETGKDTGDAPGEFQFWVEREHMDEVIAERGALHPIRRNAAGLYGLVPGDAGHMVDGAGEALTAFVLDPRFDFRKTYWLFTGISGTDPKVATIGSAAWASFVVDGDELREIDEREAPKDWPYGLFAIGAARPDARPSDPKHFGSATDVAPLDMVFPLNASLARWAYGLTRNVHLLDTPALAAIRATWVGFPAARAAPTVIMGDTLGSRRYWHGAMRTAWAERWVALWTRGQGRFAMTNMESQSFESAVYILGRQGLLDPGRVMVLRTASNFSEPLPGQSPVASVGDEAPGQLEAFESNYRAGAPVVHEILAHWGRYADHVP